MTSTSMSRRSFATLTVLATVLTFCATLLIGSGRPAAAAVGPGPVQQPATSMVTADALPTVQIDGVVWKQVVAGNTVYAGGNFANARPAGSPAGTNQVPRTGLLAYDITTGNLITSFNPVLNGIVYNLALSPDGSTLYVVGDFTTVNGATRNRIAAFSTATGALLPFSPNINSTLYAVTVTPTTVYVGGMFSTANGVARSRLAAFDLSGNLLGWAPAADYKVNDMVVSPSGSKVVIGGAFTTLNGNNVYGFGAVDAVTGASVPWAANASLQSYGTAAAWTSLSTDGTAIYATSYNFHGTGNIEGATSVNPETGAINWVEDCHGDTYGAFAANGAVYTVGHPHYCGNLNGAPDFTPRQWRRSMAFTHDATGTLAHDTTGYPDHYGMPAPSIINWFPDLTTGTFTGQGQAAWNVTGNSQYLVEGGEFLSVNGVGQQGLVRFGTRAVIPKAKSGPRDSGTGFTPTVTNVGPGSVRIAIRSNWDRDSKDLNYSIVRNGTSTVWQGTVTSFWWSRPMLGFVDTGLPAGTPVTYTVVVTDPDGNSYTSPAVTITPTNAASPLTSFDQQIVSDGATNYWPLNEASGTTVFDAAGFNDMDASTGVTRGVAGPFTGENGSSFTGDATGLVLSRASIPAPNTVSVSAWVKTTTTTGGRIVGLGNNPTSVSTTGDRMLYLDNSGKVYFGVINSTNADIAIASSAAINNGSWHQVVGTYGNNTMSLWVDGVLVAQRTDVAPANPGYNGWWRIGGDGLTGWTNAPTSNYLKGSIASVAVFPTVLSRTQVQGEYVASGRTLTVKAAPGDAFGQTVFSDDPSFYYRLDEASGTTATDAGAYNNPGRYSGTVAYRQPSTVTGPTGTGVKFNGSTGTLSSTKAVANPLQYSTEAWFKTSTTAGGKIIGFGNAQTGSSAAATEDRHVYMLTTGQLVFGALNGSQQVKLTTTRAYNDNAWHQVVATQGSAGMSLYVDGQLVTSNANAAAGKYTGYWRIGGDGNPWSGAGGYFNGTLDEVSEYSYVLSPSRVAAHYAASPIAVNLPPTASFTATSSGPTGSFDASASRDNDGSIASYAWKFGDGTSGSGVTTTHAYAASGTYQVTLTVTDNKGATASSTQNVSVTVNAPPTAVFGSSVSGLTASFDGTGSSDQEDGTVSSYSWNFGDGSPADSTATPKHTYAALGTYQVTLTVTDSKGATGTVTHAVQITQATGPFVSDAFGRTVVGALGTADTGGAWSTTGGGASNFGVTPGSGALTLTKSSQRLDAWVGSPQTASDVLQTVALSTLPTGNPVYVNATARRVDAANGYYGKLVVNTDGTVTIRVAALINNVETVLGSPQTVSGVRLAAGTPINLRVQAFGTSPTTVRARAWVGSTEPTTWQVTGTDSTAALQAPGLVGTILQATGATTGYPITASVSSFQASIPATSNTPVPTASFTFSPTADHVTFDASGSTDTNGGTITNYAWDFGDGHTASGPSATASNDYTASGTYAVTLTVTDSGNSVATTSRSVTVNASPTASFSTSVTGRTVSFDASGSTDPDGAVSTYAWDFGDGQSAPASNSATTMHTYAGGGPFQVTLTITDNGGATANTQQSVALAPSPTAAFTVQQNGYSASFDASASTPGSGTITSYAWNYGDGATDTGVSPSHTYTSAGTYQVTLTVTDSNQGTATVTHSVTANLPPSAAFTSSSAGLAASFDPSSSSDQDGTISSYSWTYGDGASGSGNPGTHTYTSPGTYQVTLTVTDNLGAASAVTQPVTVSGPFVSDAFNRTVSGGLGSAPVGGAWTAVGSASKFSVTPGAAKLNESAASTKLESYIGPQQTSSDVLETVSLDKVPAGSVQYLNLVGRRIDASNYYYAKVTINPNGSVQIRVGAVVAGVDSQLGTSSTVAGLTYTAGTSLSIRMQTFGTSPTTVQARVWKTAQTEPTAWQSSGSDSTAALQAPGIVGMVASLPSGTTNAPIVASVTSFVAQGVSG